MSLTYFVSLAGAVFGLLGIVGAAVVGLLEGRRKVTMQTLVDDNDALNGRVKTLEATEATCRERLGALEASNTVLTEKVTSAAAVAALAARIEDHHQQVVDLLTQGAGR